MCAGETSLEILFLSLSYMLLSPGNARILARVALFQMGIW